MDHSESPGIDSSEICTQKGGGTTSTPLFLPTFISSSQDFRDFHPRQEAAMGSCHKERGSKKSVVKMKERNFLRLILRVKPHAFYSGTFMS